MVTQIGSVGESEAPEARKVKLEQSERDELVKKRATCPFLGSAIATERLPVLNHAANPLAHVQDVIALGNSGGGYLGYVLWFFAGGNHSKMRGSTGNLDTPVPPCLFSLDLPGSQGSHAGHSGILQGDPTELDSGRFSEADFQRLVDKSQDGFIKRSNIALFIAGNVARDPNSSRSFPVRQLARELAVLLHDGQKMKIRRFLARVAGSHHLVGSAGEFGLLLAFLHESDNTRRGKDPTFSMAEITAMFKEKKLPDGWEAWKKTVWNWIHHTSKLALGAWVELRRIRNLSAAQAPAPGPDAGF